MQSELGSTSNDRERSQLVQKIRQQRLLVANACELDLEVYFRQAWPILEPATPLVSNWHHGLFAEYLLAAHRRQIRQLIFNLQPREAKSTIITVCFPTWVWAQPEQKQYGLPAGATERFMFWSYADALATKHSVDRRNLIRSSWYQANWGSRFQIQPDQDEKSKYSNDKRGHMAAYSLLGGGMGEGGDFSITDDPNDPVRSDSDAEREQTNLAYDAKAMQRVNNENRAVRIITQQRTHELDLTGHVLSKDRDGWTWVRVPHEAPVSVYIKFPISGRKMLRKKGDILNPARLSREQGEKRKKQIGTYRFSGQFGQAPSPPGGTIFKRTDWRYYKRLPQKFERTVLYVDSAFKGEEDSCPTAMEAWGEIGADKYLIDWKHGVMDFNEARRALMQFVAQFKTGKVKIERSIYERDLFWPLISRYLIEDTANGPAIIVSLSKKIPGLLPGKLSFPWSNNQRAVGKVERARAVSPWQESHNLWLPHEDIEPRVGGFVDECAAFPKGALADRVDAMTGALIHFMTTDSGEFTEQMAQGNGKGILTSARKVGSDGEEEPGVILDAEPSSPRHRRARW